MQLIQIKFDLNEIDLDFEDNGRLTLSLFNFYGSLCEAKYAEPC